MDRLRSSPTRERQGDGAAKIRGRIPRQFAGREVELRHPLEKAPHRHLRDQPRHLAAEAEMLASAETEMTLRAPLDVVDVRTGKFPPIAVAGAKGERDLVADSQRAAVQRALAHDRALEALRRGVEAQRFLDRRLEQRKVRDNTGARLGMIVQIEREHAHEARKRFHPRHHEGGSGEHDFPLAQAVAVDLGLGEVGDEIVGGMLSPHRDLAGDEVAQLVEGGDVLGVAALDRLVGRHRQDDPAPDLGVIALGQTHRAEQQPDRDSAGEVVDELEAAAVADALERAIGDREGGGDELLGGLAREGRLAEGAQPIVARRIGRPERRAGTAGKLVDHVALGGRERLPVARRLYDVVVARENPEPAALAPIAGMLLAQDLIVRKWISIDFRRIEIECFHRAPSVNPAYFAAGRGYHGGREPSLEHAVAMSKDRTAGSAEDRLIARYFKPLAKHPGAFGLGDDAASIEPPAGCDLVLTTDGVIGGVHFFPDDPPDTVAKKALRANLSDLAAKGARPLGFLLALALPAEIHDDWLAPFARGLGADADLFGCPLLGGDTDRTPGPLSVSIAMLGAVPHGEMLRRAGGRPGDRVVVTGTIGDAALGLLLRRDPAAAERWRLTPDQRDHLESRYLVPQPRTAIAATLRAHASAAAAEIEAALIPLSDAARAALARDPALLASIVTGGDDYEVLACVPPGELEALRGEAAAAGIALTAIGAVAAGQGEARLVDQSGKPLSLARPSYSHF